MKKVDSKKNILVIVSGGIAAYKSLDLIRLFLKNNFEVNCIITKSVPNFVSPLTFESLLGKEIYSDLFSLNSSKEMSHINLGQEIDLVLVVPATANFIGKMANGIADDLASTVILASNSPIFLAPAMNTKMLKNQAVQDNLKLLKKRGIKILEPNYGKLACGQEGSGKLADINEIFQNISQFFESSNLLAGKSAVVTSGPSIESIDPVRYISNYSSGKQGIEIARALSNAGAKTTLICGPTHETLPINVKIKKVTSGDDFLNYSINNLPTDIYISVAAISDWKIKKYYDHKIKKRSKVPEIKLTKNIDVLKTVSMNNNRPKLVIGFAAETQNLIVNAQKKLEDKKCDWILANLVNKGKGFNNKKNKVTLIRNNIIKNWPMIKKSEVAQRLVIEIHKYFSTN